MVAIDLEGVWVRYPATHSEPDAATGPALADVDLHVHPGEFLVLAGPSGSGKTTVLRTIAGLNSPSAGVVRIAGQVVNHLPPGARDLALVTQYETVYPHLTVAENLGFALRVRKLSQEETDRRVRAEAQVLGLWSRLRRKPPELSSGERQRTALGRATTRRPQAFLMDEPLASLDAHQRGRVRAELRSLQRGLGVTTVYVTHDQRDAMALADRIALLDRGSILQIGPPMELYERPETLFAATFLGTPPMGLLRGRAHDDGTTAWLDVGGWPLRVLPQQRLAVTASHGTDLVIGLRPAAIVVTRDRQQPWTRQLSAEVMSVEPLGAVTQATAVPTRSAAQPGPRHERLVFQVPGGTPLRRGDVLPLSIDMREAFLFDGQTERVIYKPHFSP